MFLLDVPVGLLLLAVSPGLVGVRGEAHCGAEERRALDPGLALLAVVLVLFTVPVVLGCEQKWPLWGWAALAWSGLLVPVFARYGRGWPGGTGGAGRAPGAAGARHADGPSYESSA